MKVTHINTYDSIGGAAIATYRLHKSLREQAVKSCMVVAQKNTDDEFVLEARRDLHGVDTQEIAWGLACQQYLNCRKTSSDNMLVSFPSSGCDLSSLSALRQADIIHIHWIARFQSPMTLQKIFALGKPVVWTLHDQRPFTGGCHCVGSCRKFMEDCSDCPQLRPGTMDITRAVLRDQLDLTGANLHIVTPSRWLRDLASQSSLFKGLPVEHIPNSVQTDIFFPYPKKEAREKLGIGKDTITFVFGAENINIKIKGLKELCAAIDLCMEDQKFRQYNNDKKILLLIFGRGKDEAPEIGMNHQWLGFISSEQRLRDAYCAADYLLLPSLEDNFPNAMLEAMSCGTPVFGFRTGGIPEQVKDGVTGFLAPTGDVANFAELLLRAVHDDLNHGAMGRNCRDSIMQKCSPKKQSLEYLRLYERIAGQTRLPVAGSIAAEDHPDSPVAVIASPGRHTRHLLGLDPGRPELAGQEGLRFIRSITAPQHINLSDGYFDDRTLAEILDGILQTVLFFQRAGMNDEAAKRFAIACSLYQKLESKTAIETMVLHEYGNLARKFNLTEEALVFFRDASYRAPDSAHSRFLAGVTLRELGRLDEALLSFREATERDPLSDKYRFHKGVVLRELGRLDEALKSFREALVINPDSVQGRYYEGIALKELGNHSQALQSFKKASAQNSRFYASIKIWEGTTLKEMGEINGALESYRVVIARDPQNMVARIKEIDALALQGKFDDALESANHALGIAPENKQICKMKEDLLKRTVR